MRKIAAFILLTCFACSSPAEKAEGKYFSLDNYFKQEEQRLKSGKLRPDKTVKRNHTSEHKPNAEVNWTTELALFRESDINKPAWKNSYRIKESAGQISYIASDSSLRTREISIKKDKESRPVEISIHNRTQNSLFSSEEHLIYKPGSVYLINKKQRVIFLGSNNYTIIGKF